MIVQCYRRGEIYLAAAMVVLSGVTDIADGFIARKWNQTSELGKILDPVADKVTQGELIWLLALLAMKEFVMILWGLLVIRICDQIHSAQWFGKLTTFVLWCVIMGLFLFPATPREIANVLAVFCAVMILLSLILYVRFYVRLLRRH